MLGGASYVLLRLLSLIIIGTEVYGSVFQEEPNCRRDHEGG